MDLQTLSYSEENGILQVRLNRPEKRNAINAQMLMDIERFFAEVATRDSAKVIILSGEGKGFSSGTDMTSFGQIGDMTNPQAARRFVKKAQRAISEIESLEKVVIACVHGFAYGAALELILACDLRIASVEALFNLPEVNVALVPDLGGSQRLPRIVGVGRAKELILTGKTINAVEAERIGLINRVVPIEDLNRAAIAMAEEVMGNCLAALGLAKKNIDMSFGLSVPDGLELASMAQSFLLSDQDFMKRMAARLPRK